MAVGIIAYQIAMVQPYHLASLEEILELRLDILTSKRLVAMRSQQALGRSEDGTLAIALYAATFEHKA